MEKKSFPNIGSVGGFGGCDAEQPSCKRPAPEAAAAADSFFQRNLRHFYTKVQKFGGLVQILPSRSSNGDVYVMTCYLILAKFL